MLCCSKLGTDKDKDRADLVFVLQLRGTHRDQEQKHAVMKEAFKQAQALYGQKGKLAQGLQVQVHAIQLPMRPKLAVYELAS